MKIRLLLLLICIVIVIGASPTKPAQADNEWTTAHGINCTSLQHVDGIILDTHTWGTVSNRNLANYWKILFSLAGPNTWMRSYGWNIPNYPGAGTWESLTNIVTTCGRSFELWVWTAYDTPAVRYLFFFNSMKSNCDGNGNHCGNHDFAYDRTPSGQVVPMTFSISTSSMNALYRLEGYKR